MRSARWIVRADQRRQPRRGRRHRQGDRLLGQSARLGWVEAQLAQGRRQHLRHRVGWRRRQPGLEFIVCALFPPTGTVTDQAGVTWNLKDLDETLGLVAIFSMVFVAGWSAAKVRLSDRLPAG